jgi:hypothetical protein
MLRKLQGLVKAPIYVREMKMVLYYLKQYCYMILIVIGFHFINKVGIMQ